MKMSEDSFTFNVLKHHLLFVRERCKYYSRQKSFFENLRCFSDELLTIGNNLIDIYIGILTPAMIIAEVEAQLLIAGKFDESEFSKLVSENHGYYNITISDGSVWILRRGKIDEKYIHLHPARNSAYWVRFHANTWKTVVLFYYAKMNSRVRLNMTTPVINRLRKEFLGISPIKGIGSLKSFYKAYDLLLNDKCRDL